MRTTGALVALALLVAATPGHAGPASKRAAEAAYADGQKKYAASDFLGAAARFEAAFELDPDPVYLFNAAQAYRFGKACTAAADHYRKFLAAAPVAPNRAKVERYIDEMTACAKTEVVTPPPTPAPVPTAEPPPTVSAPVAPTTEPAMPRDTAPSSSASAHRSLRWVGVGVGAAGVLGIGLGLVEHAKVRAAADDREALATMKETSGKPWTTDDQDLADRLDAKGHGASKLAIASYAVGGAALAAGITMYILGSRSPEHASSQVTVVPTRDGAVVSGAFAF